MERKDSTVCFECSKTFVNIKFLTQHIKYLHPFSHSFVCKQNNCYRTFPSLNGLRKHLISNHTKYEIVQQSDIKEQIIKSNSSNPSQHRNNTANILMNFLLLIPLIIKHFIFLKLFRMLLSILYQRCMVILLYHETLFKL